MSTDDAKLVMWLGLAFLFVAGGGGIAYALFRVGRLLGTVQGDVHAVVDEVVPIIGKAGTSVDTVNGQLQKVDLLLDSAVDVADSVDTTVRAVSMAVTEPVKKVAGAMAGVGEAVSSFRGRVSGDEGWNDDDAVPRSDRDRARDGFDDEHDRDRDAARTPAGER